MSNSMLTGSIDKMFKKLFSTGKIKLPDPVRDSFMSKFDQAVNLEWVQNGKVFESVFYLQNKEHIALFDENGLMLEHRINIALDEAPELAITAGHNTGELMNVIHVLKPDGEYFELIARDNDLNRFLIFISIDGSVIKREPF